MSGLLRISVNVQLGASQDKVQVLSVCSDWSIAALCSEVSKLSGMPLAEVRLLHAGKELEAVREALPWTEVLLPGPSEVEGGAPVQFALVHPDGRRESMPRGPGESLADLRARVDAERATRPPAVRLLCMGGGSSPDRGGRTLSECSIQNNATVILVLKLRLRSGMGDGSKGGLALDELHSKGVKALDTAQVLAALAFGAQAGAFSDLELGIIGAECVCLRTLSLPSPPPSRVV